MIRQEAAASFADAIDAAIDTPLITPRYAAITPC